MRYLLRVHWILVGVLSMSVNLAMAEVISGQATVIDGDTIKIEGVSHRLQYIDAPEYKQTCTKGKVDWLCGAEAAKKLRKMIRSRSVDCESNGLDRYGRHLSVCKVGSRELNAEMVATGYALAYIKYGDQYAKYEKKARAKKLGLWAGEFVKPWDYRSRPRDSHPAPDGCTIKGNINSKGAKLYHLERDSSYSRTIVTLNKGEKWFCSEAAAVKAGWTPAWKNRKR